MKIIYSLLILLPFSSWNQSLSEQDSLLKVDLKSVTNQIEYMFKVDQLHRNYWKYGTFNQLKIDSLYKLPDKELNMYLSLNQPDSLTVSFIKKQLNAIDSINTQNVIDISEKYGFPSNYRLVTLGGKTVFGDPYILLVHSPLYYAEKIKSLAKIAYENGRLKDQSYKHILWHINGRKESLVKSMNKSIEELEKNL